MQSIGFIHLIALVLFPVWSFTQLPGAIVLLEGTVVEQVGNTLQRVNKLNLFIKDYGEFTTKENGTFREMIPHPDHDIQIEIRDSRYIIIEPRHGVFTIRGQIPENKSIRIEICVIGVDSDSNLEGIQSRIAQLEKENKLTTGQLDRMQQTLGDTLLHFNREKYVYQRSIAELKRSLQKEEQENSEKIRSFQNRIDELELAQQTLLDSLFRALEQQYVRQKEYYDEITYNLNTFSFRIKDYRDWLENIRSCFDNREASEQFARFLEEFYLLPDKINTQYDAHVAAVKRYWEDPALEAQIINLYTLILKDIHKETVLQADNSVIGYLRDASNRGRPKKNLAEKEAGKVIEMLNNLIQELDTKTSFFQEELTIF